MADRLLVDLAEHGEAVVHVWRHSEMPEEVSRAPLAWPLGADDLENLRWYLEDYLRAPFGVWDDRGAEVQARLAGWGAEVFTSIFGAGPAKDAYQNAHDKGMGVVFRSGVPSLLGLPWELMRDEAGPVALRSGGISRGIPFAGSAGTLEIPGGLLRVLMVISRPAGTADVGYQTVARPLLERLDAVRGEVDLVVLRPPTFDSLCQAVRRAADAGEPFHVVHFDGHGVMPAGVSSGSGAVIGGRATMMSSLDGEGVLAFEKLGGGTDLVSASKVAVVLSDGRVPVVVLNAAQSGAIGKDLEASIATALLRAGCAGVVAMAYSVYAVAAAEFMASFYETLFTGASLGQAVTAGRRRLFERDLRPSPRGDMPLADWLVPVHYSRKEVTFPQARTTRPAATPPLDTMLDRIRSAPAEVASRQDPFAAVDVFVGRDDMFYQLEAAARLQRVMVLTGPGGTGKTELAKGFARWWRDTGGVSDPRLVFWHSFEPGVATFGLDGVITSLGLAVFGADFALLDPAQRLEQIKLLLSQLQVLLIWDNFESVRAMPDPASSTPPLDEDGCTQLREFLAWVRDHSVSTVLITSRAEEAWLGDIRRISVGGLNQAEAAEYASYLLAPYPAAQARRHHRSFAELLEWLGGHPLAMRLTLPGLDTTGPADLLAALRGTAPLPTAEEPGVGRMTLLPASITHSYEHLAEQTRRLLPAVSLFHGIADEDLLMLFSAVEGVPQRFAGVGKSQWTSVLEDAARVGLLTGVGGGMYQIHPSLPGYMAAGWRAENPAAYAQERAACDQALSTAYAEFCRWLTRQIASGDAAMAYTIIGLQRRTLGAVLGWALDQHAWSDAEDVVRALDRYWQTRGLDGEADAWANRILAATAEPGADTPVAGGPAEGLWLYTITEQANRLYNAGQPDLAGPTYRRALAYLQGQPETAWTRRSIAVLYHQLGMTVQARGRLEEAEDWYHKSLAVREELGDRPVLAADYHQLGNIAYQRGRLEEADDWYRRALIINEELGNRPGLARTYHQLGITAQVRGRLEEAEDWYRKSLAVREELGDRPNLAVVYHQLGNIAYQSGRLEEADDWYRRALIIDEELGNRPGLAGTYHQLGMTAQVRGRLEEAENWYRKSLTIKDVLGDRPGLARTYHQLGMTAQVRGRLEEAENWYRKSLTIKEELGDHPGLARTYAQYGLLAEQTGQRERALERNVQCVSLFEQIPSPLTGTGPSALARLARDLGIPFLEQTWRRVTGQPLPEAVRDLVRDDETSSPDSSGPTDQSERQIRE